jgi:hypothetical protein
MHALTEIVDILLFGVPCVIVALIVWRTNPVHALFGALFIDLTAQLLRSIATQATAQIPMHQVAGCIAMGMAAYLVTSVMRRQSALRRPMGTAARH